MSLLLSSTSVTTADTQDSDPITDIGEVLALTLWCILTYVASSATSIKVYVQTSFDDGATWIDIACFAFTTSGASKYLNIDCTAAVASTVSTSSGGLTDNTSINGLIGDRLRTRVVSVGTYGSGTRADVYYQKR